MPPPLALVLTLVFIGYALYRDVRQGERTSRAVWIPILWLLINGSRQVSQWLAAGTQTGLSMDALSDGNAVDKAVYGALIAAGVLVLIRRRVQTGQLFRNNLALAMLIVYAGISVAWSDFPLISLKRWVKALGDPLMVMILWTDPNPPLAIASSIRRCGYVLVPLSLLFCKYYENFGRTIDSWGNVSYTGVCLDKNMFGYLLFAFGLFFTAAFLTEFRRGSLRPKAWLHDQATNVAMLAMIVWLLPVADSQTAMVSLSAGVAVVLAVRLAVVRRFFWSWAVAAALLAVVVNASVSLQEGVAEAAGRDATFTGRTGLWETVLSEPINPVLGTGYGSFWLGERLERFWSMYPTSPPIQAHNGYIEVYLNLGLIGLVLIVWVLAAGVRHARARLAAGATTVTPRTTVTIATFGLAYALSYLLYNVTEATFQGLNVLFTIFLAVTFRLPAHSMAASRRPVAGADTRPQRHAGTSARRIKH